MQYLFAILIAIFFCSPAQSQRIGIFDGQSDIGKNVKAGLATFIPATGQYILTGAGENIWGDHDEFHFAWKKLTGDFIIYARGGLVGHSGVDPHRKTGLMIRKSLDGNSQQVSTVVHGDGLTSLQFRKTTGGQTGEIQAGVEFADVLQLERKGNVYTLRAATFGNLFEVLQVSEIDMGDEVYVGLFTGSHNADVTETSVFTDVRITLPFNGVAGGSTPMTLGSNLEILDVTGGHREIVYSVPWSIQAPNWEKNGNSLLYNGSDGLMYRLDLVSRQSSVIPTGAVKNNNNDHVLSFDGTMLGLSNYEKALGGSVIYTVPVNGGTPVRITPLGPSYLHGWSPDGRDLVFCGERNGEFDVYKIPSSGGKEVQLTTAKGLDDGPEYTPDGNFIYFNSVRSGLMQIWRMKPDGSGQEQVTNDTLNNWFPHISPDGKSLIFISFLREEVEPGAHPPYKHVYIRMMPITGGMPKVIAYFYGGQGSINTPSWSPDSKKIAFISNTRN